jgi:hypothetical protein
VRLSAGDPGPPMATRTPERVPTTPSTPTTLKVPAAPPRRGRPRNPSAKVLETQQILKEQASQRNIRSSTTTITPIPDTQTDLALRSVSLETITSLIIELKNTIEKQNITIEDIKQEQQAIRAENAELKREILSLRTQVETLSTSSPSTGSWASVAAGQNGSISTTSLSRSSSIDNLDRERNCIRISTAPTQLEEQTDTNTNNFTRYLPTEEANNHIRNALKDTAPTKEAQVAGVGTTRTGYVIRFKDEQSATTARNNTEWLEILGNGTKLVKPRFPVVVHRVPTTELPIHNDKEGCINLMAEQNELQARGFKIEDVAWFKPKDEPLRQHASLGIWFDNSAGAEWAIKNGLLFGQRYIGSIVPYRLKERRCHNCQKPGHMAWACKEEPRCSHCAGNHNRQHCPPGSAPKCTECEGSHPTGSRDCNKGGHQSTQ